MKACTCFLLIATFANYTTSKPATTSIEDKRSANVTLKSVPELNVKKTSKNVFGAKNKTVIGDNNNPQPFSAVETFTDFMQELVIILNTYDDDIFEDFVNIIDNEIKKYISKRQIELKNVVADESNLFKRKSVFAQRAVINQIADMMILLKIFDTNVGELLDYINSLYRDDAKIQFQKILTDLKGYSAGYGNARTRGDFVRLIRECVRATVVIHKNLNTDVKRKLKKHIETFMTKIKQFPSTTSSTNNLIISKATISKSNTYTVKIYENVSTEDKTTKPTLKLNPTKITAPKIEEKRKSFGTNTTEEDGTIKLETSNKVESNNETAIEVKFYMTSEKPAIVYKSESRSLLVEKMFEGESTESQATGESTTAPGKRWMTKNYLGRNRELLPRKEYSVGTFDRNSRRRRKHSHTKTSKSTTERPGLKKYLKRVRQLQTEVNKLKTIYENNLNSKPYKDIENNGIDELETKDKKPSNKGKERKNFNKGRHSYEHEAKDHSEVNDSEEDVTKTNIVSGEEQDIGRSAEILVDNDIHHLPSLRSHSHNENTTREAETSTEPKSKKLVLSRKSEPLSTAKDNAVNKKLAKTRLENTKKIVNTTSNVSKDIKQSRIDETATKSYIKDTENNINETTTAHSFRSLEEAFPSIFEVHTLNQGLYPAHLWD